MQQINLLQITATKEPLNLTCRAILQINGLFIIILMFYYFYAIYTKYQTEQELNKISHQQASIEETINKTKQQVPNTLNKDELILAIHSLESIKQNRIALLTSLESYLGLQNNKFSSYLIALAKSSNENIWITNLTIDKGNITIKGQTADKNYIPSFIESLGKVGVFKNYKFEKFTIDAEDKNENNLSFMLTNIPYDQK